MTVRDNLRCTIRLEHPGHLPVLYFKRERSDFVLLGPGAVQCDLRDV